MTWKSFALRTFGALALAGVVVAPDAMAQPKPKVAVIAFENNTEWWQDHLGGAAADLLTTRLVRAGAFEVLERDQLAKVMDELGLQHSGAVAESDVQRLGQTAGVQYMIVGSISRFSIGQMSGFLGAVAGAAVTEAETALNVRLIEVETSRIVTATEAEGKKKLVNITTPEGGFSKDAYDQGLAADAMAPALDRVVADLVAEAGELKAAAAPAASVVGEGEGGSVYIDQGENHGVEVGDRFEVLAVVDEIRDASGKVLDVITDRVGVIEVTRVLTQSAVCTVVEGQAAVGAKLKPIEGGPPAE